MALVEQQIRTHDTPQQLRRQYAAIIVNELARRQTLDAVLNDIRNLEQPSAYNLPASEQIFLDRVPELRGSEHWAITRALRHELNLDNQHELHNHVKVNPNGYPAPHLHQGSETNPRYFYFKQIIANTFTYEHIWIHLSQFTILFAHQTVEFEVKVNDYPGLVRLQAIPKVTSICLKAYWQIEIPDEQLPPYTIATSPINHPGPSVPNPRTPTVIRQLTASPSPVPASTTSHGTQTAPRHRRRRPVPSTSNSPQGNQ